MRKPLAPTMTFRRALPAIHKLAKAELSLLSDILDYAEPLQEKLKIQDTDHHKIGALLYGRILTNCQAAIALAEFGMSPQAQILQRAALEALFILGAISKDKNAATEYIATFHINRKSFIEKAEKQKAKGKLEAEDIYLSRLKAEVEKSISEENAKEIKVYRWAEKADMLDFYVMAYSVLSGPVHTSMYDLEKQIRIEDGIVQGIQNEADTEQSKQIFVTTAQIIIMTLEKLFLIYGIDSDDTYKMLDQHCRTISETQAA